MTSLNKLILILTGLLTFSMLAGQQVPEKPVSYPVFSPSLLNPAITGNKDFTNINLIVRVNGSPGAQMASYTSRLPGKGNNASASDGQVYSNFGLGGFIYHDQLELSRNIGFGISGAYHISLGDNNLSALSIGAAVRGNYNAISDDGETPAEGSNSFTPNVDFGLHYYGPNAFAGISSTNILGMMSDTVLVYGDEAYIPREYNFYGGYKFILSRKHAIVLEPSLLINLNDSTFSEIGKHITPFLKLYMQNFYVGSYFKNLDEFTFFFQYQFPRFYTGMLVDFPRTGFLTSDNIILELCFGINLGKDKESFRNSRHW